MNQQLLYYQILSCLSTIFLIDAYLEYVNEKEKKYKEELIKELGGSLHEYADVSKIPLEDQAYTMHILEKYGKK